MSEHEGSERTLAPFSLVSLPPEKKEYRGLKVTQVKRLREIEKENDWLRKATSALTLDEDATSGDGAGARL